MNKQTVGIATARQRMKPAHFHPLIVLVILIIAIGVCAYIYIVAMKRQRETLTQHHLRHLQTITTMITERIASIGETMWYSIDSIGNKSAVEKELGQITNWQVAYRDTIWPKEATDRKHLDYIDSAYYLLDFIENQIHIAWLHRHNNDTLFTANTKFESLLTSFDISGSNFDCISILNNASRIVHRSQVEFPTIDQIDSIIIGKKKDSYVSAIRRADVGSVTIAGVDYQFYFQPAGQFAVCAFLATDKFEQLTRSVPMNVVITLLIVLILLLVVIPLISIGLSGPHERVTRPTMYASLFGIVFGSALLTLLICDGVYLKGEHDAREENKLDSLAAQIKDRAMSEFHRIDSMMDTVESRIADKPMLPSVTNLFCKNSTLRKDPDSVMVGEDLFQLYPYFDQLYWLDSNAFIIAKWATTSSKHKRTNRKDREYYIKIKDGRQDWIQPHISRGNAKFMVAYSRRVSARNITSSDTALVMAVDFLPRSLVDVRMPDGYGFIVANSNGQVLFHSTSQRNLHENIFTECGGDLQSMVRTNSTGTVNTRYWNKNVIMFGRPWNFKGQSWYLITYSEQDNAEAAKGGILVTSLLMYILFLFPFLAGALMFHTRGSRSVSWLWHNQAATDEYAALTIVTVLASITCLAGAMWTDHLPIALVLCVFIPHAVVSFVFWRLDVHSNPYGPFVKGKGDFTGRSVRMTAIGIQCFCVFVYLMLIVINVDWNFNSDEVWWKLALTALLAALLLVLLINYGVFRNTIALMFSHSLMSTRSSFWSLVRQDKVQGIDGILSLRINRIGLTDNVKVRWYRAILTSLCILTGAVPMIVSFRISYDMHTAAKSRLQESDFMNKIMLREESLSKQYREKSLNNEVFNLLDTIRVDSVDVYWDQLDSLSLDSDNLNTRNPGRRSPGSQFSTAMLDMYMFALTEYNAVLQRSLSGNTVTAIGIPHSTKLKIPRWEAVDSIYVHGLPGTFSLMPRHSSTFPPILFLALYLAVLILVIRHVTRRLFFVDVQTRRQSWPIQKGRSYLFIWSAGLASRQGISDKSQNVEAWGDSLYLDISTCPESTDQMSRTMCRLESDTWVEDTCGLILQHWSEQKGWVVIDNLEYRYENPVFNMKKLELLEALIFTHSIPLVVSCSVAPDFYFLDPDAARHARELRNRWKRVLTRLIRVFEPVPDVTDVNAFALNTYNPHRIKTAKSLEETSKSISNWRDALIPREMFIMLSMELDFLESTTLQEEAVRLIRERVLRSVEELRHWIVSHCVPIYNALWMTCTRDEKLVLYHLAYDGFVPYESRHVVLRLMQRGLLVIRPNLTPFTAAFEQFVQRVKTNEEIREWELEEPPSIWSNIRLPLIAVIVAAFVCVFYLYPEFFDSTITRLTAVAGAIMVLLRFRGVLPGLPSGSSDLQTGSTVAGGKQGGN